MSEPGRQSSGSNIQNWLKVRFLPPAELAAPGSCKFCAAALWSLKPRTTSCSWCDSCGQQRECQSEFWFRSYTDPVRFSGGPALLRVFVPFVVEVQRDLSIQTDPEVVVHDALLCVAVPETHKHKVIQNTTQGPGGRDEQQTHKLSGSQLHGSALTRRRLMTELLGREPGRTHERTKTHTHRWRSA